MESQSGSIFLQLLFLVFLTLVNAFFAGAEMAVVSVNKNKIMTLVKEGNRSAKLLTKLFNDSTRFLSTIQVAITFAGFFSSASAATGISQVLSTYIMNFGFKTYAQSVSVVVVTIILSYFTLVFGELVPKRIALRHSEAFSLMCVKPIYFISKVLSPFIKLLSVSTNTVLRLFKIDTNVDEEITSEEEIISLLRTGQATGIFEPEATEMINAIFTFDDKTVRDIMVPSVDVYLVDINQPISTYVDELLDTHFSRIPLYDGNIDNIVGLLHLKDFNIEARRVGFENVDVKSIMKPPYFVPDSKNTKDLFTQLQKNKQHMAILIDEYGAFSGIVTIEDLVEEIVGDLNDEYSSDEVDIQIDGDSYIIDGTLSLVEINEELDLDLKSEHSDTLSGLLIEKLGYIPTNIKNLIVDVGKLRFEILELEDKRIVKVRMKKIDVD